MNGNGKSNLHVCSFYLAQPVRKEVPSVVVVGGSVRELESSLKKSNLHKMQTKPDKIAGGTTPRVEVLWQSGTTCDVAGSPDGLNR